MVLHLHSYSFQIFLQPWLAQIPWLILHIQVTIDQILKEFVISNETTSVVQDITRKKPNNAIEKLRGQGCVDPTVLVELEKMKIKVLIFCLKEKT